MFLKSRLLENDGFVHGFSTREGGVSPEPWSSLNLGGSVGDDPAAVEENHQRFARSLGIPRDRFRAAIQVHGDGVILTGEEPLQPSVEADALIATVPGIAAAVKTADCVPILLASRRTGEVAAVHAGWRGTVAEIVGKAVSLLGARGSLPGDLLAAIGPAIGPCCYEVSEELASRFQDRFGGEVVSRSCSRPHLDLALANRILLVEAGLAPETVENLGICTSCGPDRFFSHRRDRGLTGRHLSVIVARQGPYRSLS